jgi:hypothetical protein
VPTGARRSHTAVAFALPSKARQGRGVWYLVRLHAVLRISAGGGPGSIYLSSLVNGAAANQVEVEVRRTPECSSLVRWSTVDLLEGFRARESCGSTIEVDTTNFVQYRGIRPGLNHLAFQLERFRRAEVRTARILPDSGISVSRLGPAKLTFEPAELTQDVHPGTRFDLPFVLRNVGDRPARRLVVELAPVDGLDTLGATRRRYGEIAPGGTLKGAFRLRAKSLGHQQISIAAVSTANHPEIGLDLAVSPRSRDDESVAARILSMGGVVAIGLGLFVLFLGWRRRPNGDDLRPSN